MTVTIRHGDCREVLKTLPDQSVHCCVTSPPYFGLRDYGTAKWDGADPDCDHTEMTIGMSDKNTLGPTGYLPPTNAANVGRTRQFRDVCGKCGATRIDSQIGLEATPDAFVAEMVAVFREVRRVLRDDGTLWLNLGDSYASSVGGVGNNPSAKSTLTTNNGRGPQLGDKYAAGNEGASVKLVPGLPSKNLIGIPWRVAFALQADGWYLRQDIIWSKPNPMPESVTDRCTKAHEYIFLLSKSARYFYDADAIAELALQPIGDLSTATGTGSQHKQNSIGRQLGASSLGANHGRATRNRRSVWEIATAPFSEAHFATFPPDLIEPCIKAGCPVGGTVLDPFGGAGTTGLVADRLGRDALLIELNPEYAAMAQRRIEGDAGMFAMVSAG